MQKNLIMTGTALLALFAAILISGLAFPLNAAIPGMAAAAVLLLAGLVNQKLPLFVFIISVVFAKALKTDLLETTFLVIPGLYLALSTLIQVFIFRKKVYLVFGPVFLALSLGVWSAVSAYMNGGVLGSRPYWLVVILFLILQLQDLRLDDFKSLSWMILGSLTVISLLVFLNRLTLFVSSGGTLTVNQLHGAELFLGDKNTVGMYISMGLPVAYFLIKDIENPVQRRIIQACFVILLLGIFSVFSLGVVIGVIVMFGLMVIFDWDTVRQNKAALLVGLLVLALYVAGPLMGRVQRQIQMIENRGILALGTTRLLVWLASLDLIQDQPLFGHGIGVVPINREIFPYVPYDYWKRVVVRSESVIVPHNSLITVAVQIGLPGAILYGLIWSLCFWYMLKEGFKKFSRDNQVQIYSKMFLVVLAGGFTQSMALTAQLDKMLWTMMGLAVMLFIAVQRENITKTQLDPAPSKLIPQSSSS